jgi:AraC family transcriptional regulator of arabinose operon
MIARWGERLGSDGFLSEDEASGFLQEFLGGLDHGIIYEHEVMANVTRVERGVAIYGIAKQCENQFGGTMPCWTLHLTVGGKALFLNDRMEVEAERGDLMLFHPGARYHYGLHPAAQCWEHLWVLFQPRPHWQEWLKWEPLDDHIWHLRSVDPDATARIEGLFRQLIALNDDPSPSKGELKYNRLEELLIRAKDCCESRDEKVSDARVRNACDYMQAHMAERFSIDDVARACNLSSSRLMHLFKQQMGVSPKSWSNSMRLQQARKLLLNSSRSVAFIADEVGYEDPNQFTRYFTKNVGCSPREFRQSYRASGPVTVMP